MRPTCALVACRVAAEAAGALRDERAEVVERLAVDETGERELDEVPCAGEGRRAPMPRLLDAEEKPRLSREEARSEDPEEHAGNRRQTGEARAAAATSRPFSLLAASMAALPTMKVTREE